MEPNNVKTSNLFWNGHNDLKTFLNACIYIYMYIVGLIGTDPTQNITSKLLIIVLKFNQGKKLISTK